MSEHGHYYLKLCHTDVDVYKKMSNRGDKHDDIALCIYMQLKELDPECNRYRKIFFWARQNLDNDTLDKYGFGKTEILPFPIDMHDKRYLDHEGNAQELYCITHDNAEEGEEEEIGHEEALVGSLQTLSSDDVTHEESAAASSLEIVV
ncbi:MAG: hypothetical protein ACTSUE_13045 [Promethearchaeota archaeon]